MAANSGCAGRFEGNEAVHALILALGSSTLALGGAAVILAAERRVAALPRPSDAMVTAVSALTDYPAEGTTTIAVAIANPGATAVLVGVSARGPGWPGSRTRTTTPYRTTRRRYRAGEQATVAAVPPRSVSRLSVHVAAGRRCRVVVVAGQPDGRLQVISVPVSGKPTASASSGTGLLRPPWTRSPRARGAGHAGWPHE